MVGLLLAAAHDLDVLHRSFPWGDQPSPDLADLGVFDWAVVTARDPWALAYSQLDHQHAATVADAVAQTAIAYANIHDQLSDSLTCSITVTYEAFVARPRDALRTLLILLGSTANPTAVYHRARANGLGDIGDGNAKYYGGAHFRRMPNLVTDGDGGTLRGAPRRSTSG
jgi:hypothetical protein